MAHLELTVQVAALRCAQHRLRRAGGGAARSAGGCCGELVLKNLRINLNHYATARDLQGDDIRIVLNTTGVHVKQLW